MFAVWVTGKKPKGAGWSLDASLKRDTGKWLQVMGRVRVTNRVVTLEAVDVTLNQGLRRGRGSRARPEPTPPPPPRPRAAADGGLLAADRRRARAAARHRVQDPVRPATWTRSASRTTCCSATRAHAAGRQRARRRSGELRRRGCARCGSTPATCCQAGADRRVVLLLPGIQDIDGMPLETRQGIKPGAAADVLRFQVQAPGLTGDAGR